MGGRYIPANGVMQNRSGVYSVHAFASSFADLRAPNRRGVRATFARRFGGHANALSIRSIPGRGPVLKLFSWTDVHPPKH